MLVDTSDSLWLQDLMQRSNLLTISDFFFLAHQFTFILDMTGISDICVYIKF